MMSASWYSGASVVPSLSRRGKASSKSFGQRTGRPAGASLQSGYGSGPLGNTGYLRPGDGALRGDELGGRRDAPGLPEEVKIMCDAVGAEEAGDEAR